MSGSHTHDTNFMVILSSGRYLASDFPQLAAPPEAPEWWKASFGGSKVSYGKKTNLSIIEQRQGLPIYKLKAELVEVNQYGTRVVLVIPCVNNCSSCRLRL